jgi:hypothetical protein
LYEENDEIKLVPIAEPLLKMLVPMKIVREAEDLSVKRDRELSLLDVGTAGALSR